MPGGLKTVVQRLRGMAGAPKISECNDRQLLERFANTGEQAAFAALVERHGSLVLGVCRRVLHNAEDAEDAFQATFLVLARKADSGGWQNSISNWLYGVAYRVALKTRSKRSRQRHREQEYRQETPAPTVAPAEQMTWGELRSVLDAELQRLPARYRAPLILCYLEGKTRDEAAQQLGWSAGSVKGRLERGREMLRLRLAKRGLAMSAVLCASLLPETGQAAMPVALAAATAQNAAGYVTGQAAGLISSQVLSLAQGVMKAMFLAKIKVVAAVMVSVSVLTLGAVGVNSAFFDEGRENAVRAVVKSVDPQKGTITVQTFAGERPAEQTTTYNLAGKDVKVTINDRGAAKLTDLVEGTRVVLRMSADDDVQAINAYAPAMRVRVKSVDPANKTITVYAGERGETRELKLAADAKVPEKIEPDTIAEVVLSLDKSTVLALGVGRRDGDGDAAQRRIGAGVRGVALNVDAKKGTIEILTGTDTAPRIATYQVSGETQYFINERPAGELKLENIPRAARVTFRSSDDGKIISLSVLSPMAGGVIDSVDAKAGTLALRAEGGLKNLKMAPTAAVQAGDRRMDAGELKAGMRVFVQLSLDGNEVQAVRVIEGDGERRPGPRDGDIRKDGQRRDPPREGERPVERRDPPREGDVNNRPIEKRDGQ